jgi:DNA-binding MarR family transcriptional regulator
VERRPDTADRRVVRNALTAAGREMVDRPWETRRAVLANALRDASAGDRAAISRGLDLLCRALEDGGEGEGERPGEHERADEGNVKERATT